MEIIGNLNTANKFYVIKDDNSIEWVSDIKTAKQAAENPKNKNWYNQPIYATNENILKVNNKLYLASQAPKQHKEIQYNNFQNYCDNSLLYIQKHLKELALNLGYNSVLELISWKDSKIKEYKDLAKKFIMYRDEIYTYRNKQIEQNKKLLSNEDKPNDFNTLYLDFINNLPKFEQENE